ncbi:MAG: sigma-54-dependent Fis family transcriptional regulator [bacterium]|nr:sigma-54-dependent Fis family transcriptional regulator [bacterium]
MFKESAVKIVTIMVVGALEHGGGTLAPMLPLNCEILSFRSGHEAEAALAKQTRLTRENIRVIICEQNRQGTTGAEFLERSVSLVPWARRILLSDYSRLDTDALQRAQLYRFITKPYTLENLSTTIRAALEGMGNGQRHLRCDLEIVGRNPGFLAVLDLVRRVSDSKASVLVRGETGTGKELIARASHCGKEKPYVVVNCSALPETLFESEMFGFKRGAFTGAYRDRMGRVAQAEGGTLFIDEVAEIPLRMQAKLLRFLQFGEFQPVGSDRIETADVRIVAATNRDLEKRIEDGSFRKDLFYRLKVLEVTLPPLRERPSDIRLLANAFIKKYWTRPGSPILDDHALKVLKAYDFPGNVRELENVIQRACLLARTEEIDLDVLPLELIRKVREKERTKPAVLSLESREFPRLDKEALKRARSEACTEAGNRVEREFLNQLLPCFETISGAAAHAGMQRTYLHNLMTKHGINHNGKNCYKQ